MATKSFQKKAVVLLTAAFSSLIVAFSFCPIFKVFADDSSKVLVSFDTGSGNEIYFYTEQTMYYTEDAYTYNDIVVPVYFRFKNNYNLGYFSGYVVASINPFNFVDGNSNRLVINYFEDISDSIYVDYIKSSGSYQIVFDNAHIRSNVDIPIGYMHLMSNSTSGSLTITCNNRSQLANIGNNQLYETTYEYGAANAISYAINNSNDINEIINELYLIRNNSVLLADVVDNLENINGILGNIYNYMATMNSTQLNSMRQLVYALSGVDLSTTSASALSQATYDRWVKLIYDAINYQGPDSSQADQAADTLEDAHEVNDVAQDSAYQAADSAMQNVDFNITVPNGLTNAALTIGNYITSIYGNLGSDLQFLITATLTIGLITVILGVINRYPKNTYTTESETVSTGERNGKRFSSSYKTTTKRRRYR